jgi:DNA repair protein RAD57
VYISTESALSTRRLAQLVSAVRRRFPDVEPPVSMDRVLAMLCADLEVQDHILNYQLEVAIRRCDVGLVVLDSVAANYRAEFERAAGAAGPNLAKRSTDLTRLGALLRRLAREYDIAVVVANQVSDRFGPAPTATSSSSMTPRADILTLDHQQRWFTGWGDELPPSSTNPKTPSLGLTWTNCLSARIALIKEPVYSHGVGAGAGAEEGNEKDLLRWRRWMKVVFAPWAGGGSGREVEFVISTGGVGAVEEVVGSR